MTTRATTPNATDVKLGGKATEGAVYVEFLIVFLPIFFFFLGLVQLIYVEIADIIVKHSAALTVRSAIVVLSDDPDDYGGVPQGSYAGKRKEDIETAARIPLSTLTSDKSKVDVKLNGSKFQRNDPVTVTVTLDYTCRVPGGSLIVCGGSSKKLQGEATLPNQGVEFEY